MCVATEEFFLLCSLAVA